ncbi:zinc-binding dehydrogenase [Piscinibacter gummiphilus]|uniref:NADH oxidase n=1 Tax=Piscinibacter gummiphilus TaxID=946333 RepID=A0A1W6LBT5_9BURK|nr:zinc-binding dehydrogenase [Piscinibacter gummiphilus]ARN21700.1 NADH oxidase [Piscinibacter gummiphilus]ATU66388.1 NADH oxidase [Piscinibacter gummiphilus]GLS95730.1 NADH oxidoreductase [Piscinibacter gummiphilus]
MSSPIPTTALQLRSLLKASGELELSLADVPVPTPKENEVLVRIEASPINPSDLALLVGMADLSTLKTSGSGAKIVTTAKMPEKLMRALASRVDESMPVGNEGSGVVVATGDSPAAKALLGKTVGVLGGSMYSQYRCLHLSQVMAVPDGTTFAEAASCFVNPLTSLGMVETMRREGHTALVHTAAASNLGQMLNRITQKDGVPLVNIVRKPEQAALLKAQGAKYVVDSSSANFMEELTDALAATGATLAFDALGGGKLAGQILTAMEAAINRNAKEYSRYGSAVHKQVYLYGGLDTSPTEFNRSFGMAWGMGGWLLTPFLQKIGSEAAGKLRARVAAELKTTFKSHYSREITLAETLQPDVIQAYGQRATGEKFLIVPNR